MILDEVVLEIKNELKKYPYSRWELTVGFGIDTQGLKG